MNELKPCPFCGGEAVLKQCDEILFVLCTECPCAVIDWRSRTPYYARMLWNKRAERACKPELQDPMFGEREYWCSECSCKIDIDDNFCWNCGAKVIHE